MFNYIFVDFNMPEMNGIELIEKVTCIYKENNQSLPKFFLTTGE